MVKTRKNNLAKLTSYFKNSRIKLLLALLLTILYTVGVSAAPYIEGLITTSLLNDVQNKLPINYEYILSIIVLLVVLYLITNLSRIVLQFLLTSAIQNAIYDLRSNIKNKISKLPINYFDKHTTGSILSTISTDVETISNALQQSLFQIMNTIIGLIIVIVIMFRIDFQLALIGITILPLGYLVASIIIKKSQVIFRRQQNALANLNGVVQEMYSGFNEIKLFNKEEDMIEKFAETNDNLRKSGFKALFSSGLLSPLLSLITYITISISIMVGILKVIDGVLVIGVVQAFIRYIWQEQQYLSQVTQFSSVIQSSFAAMTRVFDFLEADEEVAELDLPKTITDLKGNVDFNHVYFSYDENPLISDFDFKVKSGQTIAIVGPTGSGKTTIINLLMRFYDVNSGSIEVDGVDIRDMRRDDLREMFGMVLQDTWLFSGTIRENLRYGNQEATDAEIEIAAKKTNIDHFIRTLPNGYNMVINEESSNISDGEKQLLTITRALISDPKILILDEATSSVDTRLEVLIQEAMELLMEGRTSFVIAHRLSTIRNADVILVLKDGKLIERGNHEELIKENGFYAELYESQFAES
ncbi:MAG: ABC transporter ATP-binding protein [Tissierellia bacterium]|nr:ABC transporter ATP-binding protein [Tissierellia bacterium]